MAYHRGHPVLAPLATSAEKFLTYSQEPWLKIDPMCAEATNAVEGDWLGFPILAFS